jgi:hypothetical protein
VVLISTTRTETVLETLGFSPFNQLTRIVAQEHFIIQSLCKSYKSHKSERNFYITGVNIMKPLQ